MSNENKIIVVSNTIMSELDPIISELAKNAMKFHTLNNMNVNNFRSGYFVGYHDCLNCLYIEDNKIKLDFNKMKK